MFKSSLSVFFPAFNEEDNIKPAVEKALTVLEKLEIKKWEVIIVDDGSKDKTPEIADQLASKYPAVRAIHQPNGGYGQALKTGFDNARFEWVAFSDSDGQFDFSEITKFLDKTDEAQVIVGFRLNRADSVLRSIFTFGWKTLARILLGLTVKDYSCGFKLIKREVYEKVLPLEGEEKVTQIELLVKAKRQGFKFAEVGVHHYPRIYGKPTGANLKVVIRSLGDLVKLWLKLK